MERFSHKVSKNYFMKQILFLLAGILITLPGMAQGEPSTYFNIYVPPNNEAMQRNVALIITAVSDSTYFSVLDDDMDGDDDDSVEGMLMAGQSYILYMKDNGINDDALYASGGQLARNGDYYIINSNKLVYASMSTDSDWQHDFVPSVNKKSVGQKFIVYAPKVSSSPRDLNVFAFEENTSVSIYKISTSPTTQTGYTNIDMENKQLVVQRTLNPGQDIIHYFTDGRDVMQTGGTYMIESNKNVSVQYGALWGNARDGGAYVPSLNGSGAGELFYFAVPYQAAGEQEIRIVSWDDNNNVTLERYANGNWIAMNNWTLDALQPAEWVGKQNGNATYPTVFRVTCDAGKRVSVMEANWMETGSTNTSDMATMLSSENGTSSGTLFVAYMLPPSRQNNVVNPFTGEFFTGSITHFYLFAGNQNTTVTIKDAKTNGQMLNRTYEIEAGRYADAYFNMDEWKSIYNGTGLPNGPERPYVIIESTEPIAVLSTNFNDNWMTYFGSSLPQSFTQQGNASQTEANPGQEIVFTSAINPGAGAYIENPGIEVVIGSGLIPVSSKLKNNGEEIEDGNIDTNSNGSTVTFQNPEIITPDDNFEVETKVIAAASYNDGSPIPNEAVLSVETIVSGVVNGEFQQSYLSQGLQNNTANSQGLIFSICESTSVGSTGNDSWNGSWVDYDLDGWPDLFVTTKNPNATNELYRNNGDGTFTKITNNPVANATGTTVAAIWADINNSGRPDVLLVNATKFGSELYINNGNGQFSKAANSGLDIHPQYFHGAAFADFDNDGYVDLLITNFFETKFHQLYKNNGDNTFTLVTNTPISTVSAKAMAPVLADYNNDGLVDVFIPNGDDKPNSLFRNLGGFQFEKIAEGDIVNDAKNSVGASWGDYNNNGYMDLIVVNASGQNNDLYLNKGDGTFTKQPDHPAASQGGHSHSASWVDMNNSGMLDLFITNDEGASFLYINEGQGNFNRKLDEIISGNNGNAFGSAWADYNKNGQMDIAVFTHTSGNTRLFCNNGNDNKWIALRLVGTNSNRMAIGARVSLKSNGQWQHRQLLPVSGFGSQNSSVIHFGLGAGTLIDSLIVHWPSGLKQQLSNLTINSYNTILEEDGKIITGLAFHDLNFNGVRDAGEDIVPNLGLSISASGKRFSSNASGFFSMRTNPGSFTLGVAENTNWTINSGHGNYSFDGNSDSIFVELPLTALSNGYDLAVNFATTAWRRGFKNQTIVQVQNKGTVAANGAMLSMVYPEEAYLLSSDAEYQLTGPKTFQWNIGQVLPGEVIGVAITDSIGLEAFTGQILMLSASVAANGSDINLLNNNLTEEIEIVGAIDPNDMLVSPKGDGDKGYISKNQWLTYTIRFENVGTFAATYVFLENPLPGHLDWKTFELLSSSHESSHSLSNNGLLTVSYLHINLPPSELDSIGAHGYFKYSIKPHSHLSGGIVITNNARIIFDFEEPILTNTVVNTIKHSGNNEVNSLTIYPNPANGVVRLVLDRDYFKTEEPLGIDKWIITDFSGRTLLSGKSDFELFPTVDVSSLPGGVYMIRAFDEAGRIYAGKLLRQ